MNEPELDQAVRSYPKRTEQRHGFMGPEIDACGDKNRVDGMLAGSGLDAVLRGDVDVLGVAAVRVVGELAVRLLWLDFRSAAAIGVSIRC